MNQIVVSKLYQFTHNLNTGSVELLLFGNKDNSRTKSVLSRIKYSESAELVFFEEEQPEKFAMLLQKLVENKKEIGVFIECSCLSRKLIANIFSLLGDFVIHKGIKITLYCSYSLSKFTKPGGSRPLNKSFAPINSYFAGWTAQPEHPVEVIVSLGYEESKATGAVEYLEPKAKWIFIPHSPEEEFLNVVNLNNKNLLNENRDNTIDYQVLDPLDAYHKLNSLASSITPFSKLVILPFGPKVFFPISLLIALQNRQISVWHVDSEEDDFGINLEASEHTVIFSCELSGLV